MGKLIKRLKEQLSSSLIKWNLNIILCIAMFFALAVGIALAFNNIDVIRGFDYVYKKTFSHAVSPGMILDILGLHNIIMILFLPVIAFILTLIFDFSLEAFKNIFALFTFSFFSFILLINLGFLSVDTISKLPRSLDIILITGIIVIFITFMISSYGNIPASNISVLKEFAVIIVLVAIGSLPNFIAESFSYSSVYNYFFEISLIYFLGLLIKMVFYPKLIYERRIKSRTISLLFSIFVILIANPIGSVVLAGILSGLYYLFIGIIGGGDFILRFALPPEIVYLPFLIPAGYIEHLFRHGFIQPLFFFISIIYYVTNFARNYPELEIKQIRKGEEIKLEGIISKEPIEAIRNNTAKEIEEAREYTVNINKFRLHPFFTVIGIFSLGVCIFWIGFFKHTPSSKITDLKYGWSKFKTIDEKIKTRKAIWVIRPKDDSQGEFEILDFNGYNSGNYTYILYRYSYNKRLIKINPQKGEVQSMDFGYAGYIRNNSIFINNMLLFSDHKTLNLYDLNKLKISETFTILSEDSNYMLIKNHGNRVFTAFRDYFVCHKVKGLKKVYTIDIKKSVEKEEGLYLDQILPLASDTVIAGRAHMGIFLFKKGKYRKLFFDEKYKFIKMFKTEKSIIALFMKDESRYIDCSFEKHPDCKDEYDSVYKNFYSLMIIKFSRKNYSVQEKIRIPVASMLFRIEPIFLKGRNLIISNKKIIYAIDLTKKMIKWEIKEPHDRIKIYKDYLLVFSKSRGDIEVYDINNRNLLWGKTIGKSYMAISKDVDIDNYTSPVGVYKDFIYCTSGHSRTLIKIKIKDGKVIWRSEKFGAYVYDSFTFFNDKGIILDMNNDIYCYSVK